MKSEKDFSLFLVLLKMNR